MGPIFACSAKLSTSHKNYVPNVTLYGSLPPISLILCHRHLQFAGHCFRRVDDRVHSILFFELSGTLRPGGHARMSYIKTLLCDSSLHSVNDQLQAITSCDEWRVVCAGIDVDSTTAT